jgi:two-component system, NtrC family, sensor kinase
MMKKDIEKIFNNDQAVEDIELIVEEAKRCKNIVSNLLDFARQGKLHIKELDLSELLHDLIRLSSQNPASRNIIFTSNLNGKCVIRGDEDQLRQVFLNIMNNACDAMQDIEEKELKFH